MASSLGSSNQRASDIEYDYCCTHCEEDNKNSEAMFYCSKCCKLYCDPCVKLHKGIYKRHRVLDRKNVDKWGAVRREVAMVMCDEHKGQELKMYCQDHDMVCCSICISEGHTHIHAYPVEGHKLRVSKDPHRSCKVQHVPKVAKGIYQMKDFQKLPSDVSNMIQQLSNMQDSREKTHQLLLDACQDVISSLNELRKKLTKLMDEIQKKTLQQMNQLFAAMDVNIQTDKDTCKAKQDELQSLLHDIQTNGKKSETFAFSGFKKCKGKLSAAEGMLNLMTKQEYKLNFTPDTSIEQCLSTMSTFGDFTTSTRIHAASTSPVKTDHVYTTSPVKTDHVDTTSSVKTDHVYTMVNKQKYNVSMKNDGRKCDINGCCTLPNGNTVIVDRENCKMKLLNNKYQVQADYVLPNYPYDICYIADNEVAVNVCDWDSRYEIQFINTDNGKLSLTRSIELNHGCESLVYNAGQLYVGSRTALYIYTMTGQLVKKLYEDLSRDWSVYRFAVSDDGSRIYISDCFRNTLITLDNTGNKLASLTDPDMWDLTGVQVSHDGSVFACSALCSTVIQAAADGNKKLATLARKADGLNIPQSLCLDRKSSTLIVGQKNENEILVIKIK